MKPGDFFVDTYYEPETIVLKVSRKSIRPYGYDLKVVYTSIPSLIRRDIYLTRYSNDKELMPVAMITIDDKLMMIKL